MFLFFVETPTTEINWANRLTGFLEKKSENQTAQHETVRLNIHRMYMNKNPLRLMVSENPAKTTNVRHVNFHR